MSKYGLNLRPQKKKQPARPPLPTVLGFGDDDDNDVEKEISRHASKNKSLRDIEEQQKKALEEDPSVFDYDGVYDEMKQKAVQPLAQDREERRPKYIENLMKKAQERQREHEIIYERKIAKERSKDDHLYADKDKFVTSAYKKKLAETAKWMEEERLRQLREEKDDVTKKTDLSDFYFNLGKNVAFGADEAKPRKPEKPVELPKADKHEDEPIAKESDKYGPANNLDVGSSKVREEKPSEASPRKRSSEPPDVKPISKTEKQENSSVEQPPADKPKPNLHKRSEDAVAAAKERFLARKRAKESEVFPF
ncbi:hypothetical protein UlMin_032105 [Ulmus minor]